MLFRLLSALLGSESKDPEHDRSRARKLTQKEKDMLEYKLWEIAEEFKEE